MHQASQTVVFRRGQALRLVNQIQRLPILNYLRSPGNAGYLCRRLRNAAGALQSSPVRQVRFHIQHRQKGTSVPRAFYSPDSAVRQKNVEIPSRPLLM